MHYLTKIQADKFGPHIDSRNNLHGDLHPFPFDCIPFWKKFARNKKRFLSDVGSKRLVWIVMNFNWHYFYILQTWGRSMCITSFPLCNLCLALKGVSSFQLNYWKYINARFMFLTKEISGQGNVAEIHLRTIIHFCRPHLYGIAPCDWFRTVLLN